MSTKNAMIASAVASLFLSAAALADQPKPAKKASSVTKCKGINECAGKGSCAGADNACKSKNDCKGHGWVETASAKECADKGGKVLAEKM